MARGQAAPGAARHALFFPGLIKPKPARLLAILAHWSSADPHGNVFLPRPGALTATLDPPRAWRECAAAGYLPAGALALRFDQAERLAEAIRAARAPIGGRELAFDPAWARLISRPAAELPGVLEALGYRRLAAADSVTGAPELWRLPTERRSAKRAAPAAGPFAALAELISATPAALPPRRKRRGGRA